MPGHAVTGNGRTGAGHAHARHGAHAHTRHRFMHCCWAYSGRPDGATHGMMVGALLHHVTPEMGWNGLAGSTSGTTIRIHHSILITHVRVSTVVKL